MMSDSLSNDRYIELLTRMTALEKDFENLRADYARLHLGQIEILASIKNIELQATKWKGGFFAVLGMGSVLGAIASQLVNWSRIFGAS